jgi:nitroimidazol reductase NimA-like FMN-containing flavoprotein (pyridoxamine 5'-phosphate oxidase superfamily)
MKKSAMKDIEEVLRNGRTCVLATAGPDAPHTSLMVYVAASDCRTLYLATRRETRKYRNLMENPGVSILVDTRCEDPLENVRALTVSGTAREISDAKALKSVRELFGAKHSGLTDVLDAPDSAFVAVSIQSFQLLSGVREATYITVDRPG